MECRCVGTCDPTQSPSNSIKSYVKWWTISIYGKTESVLVKFRFICQHSCNRCLCVIRNGHSLGHRTKDLFLNCEWLRLIIQFIFVQWTRSAAYNAHTMKQQQNAKRRHKDQNGALSIWMLWKIKEHNTQYSHTQTHTSEERKSNNNSHKNSTTSHAFASQSSSQMKRTVCNCSRRKMCVPLLCVQCTCVLLNIEDADKKMCVQKSACVWELSK